MECNKACGVFAHSLLVFLVEATMHTITIDLPDDRLEQLEEMAARLGVAPEDLVRASLEELLTRPEEAFQRAVDHVLGKNAELYGRLA